MYEASFGLKRRPFAATPDASCFLSSAPIQAALDELVVCVEQGQGIAVMTAPAGTGKTLLCERLRLELDERFETVLLRHASFMTRRALLQTILCELNHTYHHPSEQELRLELFPAIRSLQPNREALVLICDEAHQLNDSLLEELRILADFAEAGKPLVRLVLVGQLSLEEKLAQASQEAFNQRIRANVNLGTFDRAGSLDYIDYRLTWAGGRTDEVFTTEALELIAEVSDGVPRCINQLADHSLLLAFVAEQRPVRIDLVREALSDLKQLPLRWNEPHQSLASINHTADFESESPANDFQIARPTVSVSSGLTFSYEPEIETNQATTELDSFEIGSSIPSAALPSEPNRSIAVGRNEAESEEWRKTVESFNPHQAGHLQFDQIDRSSSLTSETDDDQRSRLTRRIDFHDMLEDAYAAASFSASNNSINGDLSDEDFDIHSETADFSAASISIAANDTVYHRDISPMISELSSHHGNTTKGFREEIIVDRYTSIDAGLQPPAVSLTDTIDGGEVRGIRHNSEIPTDRPEAQITALRQFESDPFADTVDRYSSPSSQINLAEIDDLTQPINLPQHRSVELTVSDSTSSPPRDTNQIDQLASDVFSLGESLRSTGVLSSSSDSILETLRFEVQSSNQTLAAESSPLPPPVPVQSDFEVVETPPAESSTDSRPFRYLFSKLRRKQQGL